MQPLKPNPMQTTAGQFDMSFEKIVDKIAERMPTVEGNVPSFAVRDSNFGHVDAEERARQQLEDDIHARKRVPAAAQHARSFFDDEDTTSAAVHTRSPQLKAAQTRVRAAFDATVLKTSHEPADYYYKKYTLAEQRRWRCVLAAMWTTVFAAVFVGMRRLLLYMRYSG